jgi:hypothetical protein
VSKGIIILSFIFVLNLLEASPSGKHFSESITMVNDTVIPNQPLKDTLVMVKKGFSWYFKPIKFKSEPHTLKYQFQLDFRNSFISNYPINIYGLNTGFKFWNRFRIGAGFYLVIKDFDTHLLPIDLKNGKILVTTNGKTISTKDPQGAAEQHLEMYYGALNFAYTIYDSRLLELSIPLEIGYGHFREELVWKNTNNYSNLPKLPSYTAGNFVPASLGLAILIKAHRWVYFQGAIGYRETLFENYFKKNKQTSVYSQFNGLYWRVGVQINIGTIIKDYKKKPKDR